MSRLHIAERFISIQGEGRFVGEPTYFLRLAMCHLACKWCDTTEVWKHKRESFTPQELIAEFNNEGFIRKLLDGFCTLTITGGSPVVQQAALVELLTALRRMIYPKPMSTRVRLETELSPAWLGSPLVDPKEFMADLAYNCSPKLSNCGQPKDKYYCPQLVRLIGNSSACFKFVVANEADIEEAIREYIKPCKLRTHQCYLMPQASTRTDYQALAPTIAALAIKHGLRFGPREQLAIWDQATGV